MPLQNILFKLLGAPLQLKLKKEFCHKGCRYLSTPISTPTRLAEVGVFEPPKENGKYETGQLFLHKVFGYRAIILTTWLANMYDRDASGRNDERVSDQATMSVGKEVKGKNYLYYQVLIDARDSVHIRSHNESVTFLSRHDQTSKALLTVPGLDYVPHEDVLPYVSPESTPIQHELFERFLDYKSDTNPSFSASEMLKTWQHTNHSWLELTDVHRETTEGIRVTIIPFFMGARQANQTVFWWRYIVRLENNGDETVQLRERHWRIFSLSGTLETVRGRGVVGQEPILSPDTPAFQYSSHVSLQAPSGHMWGTFKLERRDGTSFDCKIPPFSLESRNYENQPPEINEG